jgi:hypothetical protein
MVNGNWIWAQGRVRVRASLLKGEDNYRENIRKHVFITEEPELTSPTMHIQYLTHHQTYTDIGTLRLGSPGTTILHPLFMQFKYYIGQE